MRATTRKLHFNELLLHQVREINLVFVVDNEILITLLILLIIRVLYTSISINTSLAQFNTLLNTSSSSVSCTPASASTHL